THTNAGTYTDTWTFAGNTNYNSASASVADSIAKANATIAVNGYSVTYDGNSHTATGTATGVKGESLAGLRLTATTHTNAGSYNDAWTFAGNSNYNSAGSTVTDTIAQSDTDARITVTGYSVTYDGLPHTATGTATGVNSEDLSSLLDFLGTVHAT